MYISSVEHRSVNDVSCIHRSWVCDSFNLAHLAAVAEPASSDWLTVHRPAAATRLDKAWDRTALQCTGDRQMSPTANYSSIKFMINLLHLTFTHSWDACSVYRGFKHDPAHLRWLSFYGPRRWNTWPSAVSKFSVQFHSIPSTPRARPFGLNHITVVLHATVLPENGKIAVITEVCCTIQ